MAYFDQVGQALTNTGNWFQTPQGQAGLLQFGLGMLSPQPRGQGFLSTLASSIGQGAEASGRTRAIETDEAERRRKAEADLRAEALAGRRVSAEERDVASKIQERKAAPGGISASALFQAQNRDTGWFRSEFAKARLDPFNSDKSDDEISASLLAADTAARKATGQAAPGAQGGTSASPSGVPPAHYEGEVRTDPRDPTGKRKAVWRSGKWQPLLSAQ